VLAAVLSAVALAAPVGSAYEAESTELVQTSAEATASKIQNLKQEFNQLKARMDSGEAVTPGVKKTIKKLIDMVTTKIQPAISEAHAADQQMINADHNTLTELNAAYVAERDALLKNALDIRHSQKAFNVDVAEWKKATEDYTLASKVYLAAYDKRNDVCCQKDNAGILDIVYTPAYYACDFSNDATADKCISDADSSISSYTVSKFAKGKAKYDDLFARCNQLNVDFENSEKDLSAKDSACDGKRDDAKNLESKIKADRKTFDPLWSESVSGYDKSWTRDLAKYGKTTARVKHDEKDRYAEWKSVDEIECMLKTYLEDDTFTQEEMTACAHRSVTMTHLKIVYPAAPAREHSTLPAWVPMDSYAAFQAVCEPANAPKLPAFQCAMGTSKPLPSCENHK